MEDNMGGRKEGKKYVFVCVSSREGMGLLTL